jgi:hypothetical protein
VIETGGNIDGLRAILSVTNLPTLLLLLALGLWHASRRPARLDLSIALLAAGLAMGFIPHPSGISLPEITSALIALIIAIFVVVDSPRLTALQHASSLAAGITISLSSSAILAIGPSLLCVISLSMVPVAVAFYIWLLPQHPVAIIGRRVMGSWILAVSLLIVAFHFKSRGH